MRVATSVSETRTFVKSARSNAKGVGLVPTMGAFHQGHLALMRRATSEQDVVVVSLFVNPTQFAPGEDYRGYPRNFEADARLAESEGVDLIFAPPPEEMYGEVDLTSVRVSKLTEPLCGTHREGHFDGVTTVCAKLFNIVQPDYAYFGEKDYQQLQVIRQMVADLKMPLSIVPVATVREEDGLALSSRNRYLNDEQRAAAPTLYRALQKGAQAVRQGASAIAAEGAVRTELDTQPLLVPQYVSALDPVTLTPPAADGPPMLLAAAAHLGKARLIDNILVEEV